MIRKSVLLVPLALLLVATVPSVGQEPKHTGTDGNIQITLNKKFIADYKNRVTIDTDDYIIDKAHPKPNPAAKDGDMHVAGRAAKTVGLPIVAEIMNAKDQKRAVDKVHSLEGSGKQVAVSGAWRLWCEHAGTTKQIQGAKLDAFTTTNPAHVFEIHPITKLDGIDLTDSFKPIKGFQPKDAHDAFVAYENVRCRILPKDDTVTLFTSMAGFNYVEFILELNEDPFKLKDGFAVQCKVRDLEGELLVRNRRMLFADGTPPADKVKDLKQGKRLHVLGLPRIDLALVDYRVQHAKDDEFKDDPPLGWNLPYEIVVVGVFPAGTEDDDD
jgi:hypothetical protein